MTRVLCILNNCHKLSERVLFIKSCIEQKIILLLSICKIHVIFKLHLYIDTCNVSCVLHKVLSFKLFSSLVLPLFFNPLMSFSRTSRVSTARTFNNLINNPLITYKKKMNFEGILYLIYKRIIFIDQMLWFFKKTQTLKAY